MPSVEKAESNKDKFNPIDGLKININTIAAPREFNISAFFFIILDMKIKVIMIPERITLGGAPVIIENKTIEKIELKQPILSDLVK